MWSFNIRHQRSRKGETSKISKIIELLGLVLSPKGVFSTFSRRLWHHGKFWALYQHNISKWAYSTTTFENPTFSKSYTKMADIKIFWYFDPQMIKNTFYCIFRSDFTKNGRITRFIDTIADLLHEEWKGWKSQVFGWLRWKSTLKVFKIFGAFGAEKWVTYRFWSPPLWAGHPPPVWSLNRIQDCALL